MGTRARPRRSLITTFASTVAATVAAGAAIPPMVACSDACPEAAPQQGDSCSGEATCDYGDCYGSPTTTAACRGGEWSVSEVSCNPPAPGPTYDAAADASTPCPATPPPEGEPCVGTASCEYGMCDSMGSPRASCTNGAWRVYKIFCDPPPPDAGVEAGAEAGGDAGDASDGGDGG